MPPPSQPSIESALAAWCGDHLPLALLKRLPTAYYWLNRLRFRWFARPVMAKETSKARRRRTESGFFERYFTGRGLDVGYGGDLVVPNCQGWDVEHGDAHLLAGLDDAAFDFVYSSHLLEHLEDPPRALANWWRVLKPGGHLILYVPDRDLFERKARLPSDVSLDHKHFFLLDRDDSPDTIGLVPLVKRTLPGAEIVHQRICNDGYRRDDIRKMLSDAEYSIEIVARKPGSRGGR
jgi:SAM-dependent methyltransferase